jgi:folate-dependent phosphoribosylglycinamide formyltransferase PurN
VKQLIYDPKLHGSRMTILCFVSGSGTNYQKIVERDPNHDYIVFTNRPGCEGIIKARANGHTVIELSHLPYFEKARAKYGGLTPKNCPEREGFEKDAWRLIEDTITKSPDLVCLAGYDLLFTDWTFDKFALKMLNVHPGDTAKGYSGLHWIPAAKAVLAGEEELRSTLFLVEKEMDAGPVIVQSKPLQIFQSLDLKDSEDLQKLIDSVKKDSITNYDEFMNVSGKEKKAVMKRICEKLQEALKVAGDWEIYPFAVHDLVARGRVAIEERNIFIDNIRMPPYGYRMEEKPPG